MMANNYTNQPYCRVITKRGNPELVPVILLFALGFLSRRREILTAKGQRIASQGCLPAEFGSRIGHRCRRDDVEPDAALAARDWVFSASTAIGRSDLDPRVYLAKFQYEQIGN